MAPSTPRAHTAKPTRTGHTIECAPWPDYTQRNQLHGGGGRIASDSRLHGLPEEVVGEPIARRMPREAVARVG